MHRPILSFRRGPRLRRALPLAAGLALALPLGAGALAAPAASAATTSCLVVDTSSDHSYASVQDAVNAAAPGDTLFVKGTCTGTTEITKNLTITGQSNGGQKTATLNGDAQGSVLTIDSGVAVTLNALVIANGRNSMGGGILDDGGTVTLNDSTVTANSTWFGGGGIANAVVTADGEIWTGGTVTLNDSTVTANNSSNDAGGIYNSGTVTLNGTSSVSNNTGDSGGGIFDDGGTVNLNGSSTITGNTAYEGGGIYNSVGSTVTISDNSTITGNTASVDGGGITNDCSATLNGVVAAPATGANVYNNHPDNIGTPPYCQP